MSNLTVAGLGQRSDYTYKFNVKSGRHGWLRLTPAYSVKFVEEILGRYSSPPRVLDPFSGTATTALSAAYHGHEGMTLDINPFLVWFGRVKTAHYDDEAIASVDATAMRVSDLLQSNSLSPIAAPPIRNIERWWHPDALHFLRLLKAAIETESVRKSTEWNLLMVAFCRTLIELSNAAFNHQSMSLRENEQLRSLTTGSMKGTFNANLQVVLNGARQNPRGVGSVLLGDARSLPEDFDGSVDLVITSPPYANRMSYVRELRPYMYWLDFLRDARSAGELDWAAIGGTWGIATSRLSDWQAPDESFEHPLLDAALDRICQQENRNGRILANYIAKYFEDMWSHFSSVARLLRRGSEVHYIVGNSTYYGVVLAVEEIYMSMLERLGFGAIDCRPIRKRNSKKELYEFDVSACCG